MQQMRRDTRFMHINMKKNLRNTLLHGARIGVRVFFFQLNFVCRFPRHANYHISMQRLRQCRQNEPFIFPFSKT